MNIFFYKQKTAYEIRLSLVGSEMCIRDRNTVGQKITRLNAPRAYCVALSSAITVLIATTLGLPVSSTHIAIGAIFGIGFLREFRENPERNSSSTSRAKRKLVRRNFVYSIGAAWIITVPASATIAGTIYYLLSITSL